MKNSKKLSNISICDKFYWFEYTVNELSLIFNEHKIKILLLLYRNLGRYNYPKCSERLTSEIKHYGIDTFKRYLDGVLPCKVSLYTIYDRINQN